MPCTADTLRQTGCLRRHAQAPDRWSEKVSTWSQRACKAFACVMCPGASQRRHAGPRGPRAGDDPAGGVSLVGVNALNNEKVAQRLQSFRPQRESQDTLSAYASDGRQAPQAGTQPLLGGRGLGGRFSAAPRDELSMFSPAYRERPTTEMLEAAEQGLPDDVYKAWGQMESEMKQAGPAYTEAPPPGAATKPETPDESDVEAPPPDVAVETSSGAPAPRVALERSIARSAPASTQLPPSTAPGDAPQSQPFSLMAWTASAASEAAGPEAVVAALSGGQGPRSYEWPFVPLATPEAVAASPSPLFAACAAGVDAFCAQEAARRGFTGVVTAAPDLSTPSIVAEDPASKAEIAATHAANHHDRLTKLKEVCLGNGSASCSMAAKAIEALLDAEAAAAGAMQNQLTDVATTKSVALAATALLAAARSCIGRVREVVWQRDSNVADLTARFLAVFGKDLGAGQCLEVCKTVQAAVEDMAAALPAEASSLPETWALREAAAALVLSASSKPLVDTKAPLPRPSGEFSLNKFAATAAGASVVLRALDDLEGALRELVAHTERNLAAWHLKPSPQAHAEAEKHLADAKARYKDAENAHSKVATILESMRSEEPSDLVQTAKLLKETAERVQEAKQAVSQQEDALAAVKGHGSMLATLAACQGGRALAKAAWETCSALAQQHDERCLGLVAADVWARLGCNQAASAWTVLGRTTIDRMVFRVSADLAAQEAAVESWKAQRAAQRRQLADVAMQQLASAASQIDSAALQSVTAGTRPSYALAAAASSYAPLPSTIQNWTAELEEHSRGLFESHDVFMTHKLNTIKAHAAVGLGAAVAKALEDGGFAPAQ